MDVFLLLLEEVERDGVQSVRSEFVFPQHKLEEIELNSAFRVGEVVFPLAHLLGLERRHFVDRPYVSDAAQEGERLAPEMIRPFYEVGEVEVLDVVPGDDVRIYGQVRQKYSSCEGSALDGDDVRISRQGQQQYYL